MIPVDISVEWQKNEIWDWDNFFYAVHYCYLFKSLKYLE